MFFPPSMVPAEPDVRPCSHNLRFCRGFNTSLIQIHRDSLHDSIIFTIGSIMPHFSHDVPYVQSIPSLQKNLNLPPPPTNTYKGLLMIMLYSLLWNIQVVQKYRFLRENLGSGRTRHLCQEPFHDFMRVCWKLGSFYPKKHRLGAKVRICAQW